MSSEIVCVYFHFPFSNSSVFFSFCVNFFLHLFLYSSLSSSRSSTFHLFQNSSFSLSFTFFLTISLFSCLFFLIFTVFCFSSSAEFNLYFLLLMSFVLVFSQHKNSWPYDFHIFFFSNIISSQCYSIFYSYHLVSS